MTRRRPEQTQAAARHGDAGLWERLATAGGLGYVPVAPGTVGSLLGAALCFPFLQLDWPFYLAIGLLLTGIAIQAAGHAAGAFGAEDPQPVIIDEVAGMWMAAIALPFQLYDLVAVFLLFRLFDVVKPGPLWRLERLPGGLGIVADDVAAGLLARVSWWLLQVNFDFL